MALNLALLSHLERHGLTNEHLELALALCESDHNGAMIWNVHNHELSTVELCLSGSKRRLGQLTLLTSMLRQQGV